MQDALMVLKEEKLQLSVLRRYFDVALAVF